MKRFPLEMYASLELNRCKFVAAGNIIAQTPLGEEFTKDAPCENGMWVCAETANGVMKSIAEVTDPIGVVFTSEKEYDDYHVGLKTFGRKIAGDMPRVGVFALGDILTTNCLQYDESEYANEEALFAALEACQTTPVYVVPVVGSPVPKLTATKPATGLVARVVKLYTVPNGERGVKYEIIRL